MSRSIPLPRLLPVALTGLALLASARAQTDYATPYVFTTVAGVSSIGTADGSGSAARFNQPVGVAVDSGGNLYVADLDNQVVRKITPAGAVTTLAGKAGEAGAADGTGAAARFNQPRGVAVDATGTVHVADYGNHAIRKITPAGVVTTIAGNVGTPGSADGTGTAARFQFPADVALDAAGNLYVADEQNHTIRKITPAGVVTTLAGTAGLAAHTNGTGGAARFTAPARLAVDSAGAVYVTEGEEPGVRKITSAGVVTTLIDVIPGIWVPGGLAVDAAGNLHVSGKKSQTMHRLSPAGVATVVAGVARDAGSADGSGTATRFNGAAGLAIDPAGNVFVADSANNTIRRMSPTFQVTTIAGLAADAAARSVDGTGSAGRFRLPFGVVAGPTGDIFVSDNEDWVLRKVTQAGVVTTLAGIAGSPSHFARPQGLAVDTAGNVYVADLGNDAIRKVTPAGVVTTAAGLKGYGAIDGSVSVAQLFFPSDVAIDGGGNLYVADVGNDAIRKVTPAGIVSTVVTREHPFPSFNKHVAVDAAGNLYVGDREHYRKITPAGGKTVLAGQDQTPGSVDGPGAAARFNYPSDMALDPQGNLFVVDTGNHTIRKISPAGLVTTVAGLPGSRGSADGTGREARFDFPSGIAVDAAGSLYVTSGTTLRLGRLVGAPAIATQPQSATVAAGGNVSFSVTASGVPDPTYQWYFNGAPFSGGTSSILNFTNARTTDAGDYTVIVTNTLGSITSAKATLTVSATTTPAPSSGGGSGGGAGGGGAGGGGAPSARFIGALAALAAIRQLGRRVRARA